MTHPEKAEKLFYEGYNCSQAVLLAFSDVTGLEKGLAARLSSSFGGGLGRMREVCGAVSGAAMVLGIARGYSNPADYDAKKKHYALVREFANRFKEKNGSVICRELLGGISGAQGENPERRTGEYYKKRPCPQIVKTAAELLDEMLLSD